MNNKNHMKLNKNELERMFRTFNARFFDGRLPVPKFGLTRRKDCLGYFKHGYPGEIRVSTYWKMSPKDIEGTLLHEMIHLYQYTLLGKTDHGPTFISYARRINQSSDYHIATKSFKSFDVAEPGYYDTSEDNPRVLTPTSITRPGERPQRSKISGGYPSDVGRYEGRQGPVVIIQGTFINTTIIIKG